MVEALQRLVVSSQEDEGDAHVAIGRCVVRMEGDESLQEFQHLTVALLLSTQRGQPMERLRIVWVHLKRVFVVFRRRLGLPVLPRCLPHEKMQLGCLR